MPTRDPEKLRAQRRRYRERHRARIQEYLRNWHAQNPGYHQAWAEANPEKVHAKERRYRAANPSKVREWAAANPEKRRANERRQAARRRARKQGVRTEAIDRQVVLERDIGICGICGVAVDLMDWHLDHIMPLAHGGEHTYTNVQVAHPSCNMAKGTKLAA